MKRFLITSIGLALVGIVTSKPANAESSQRIVCTGKGFDGTWPLISVKLEIKATDQILNQFDETFQYDIEGSTPVTFSYLGTKYSGYQYGQWTQKWPLGVFSVLYNDVEHIDIKMGVLNLPTIKDGKFIGTYTAKHAGLRTYQVSCETLKS